MSGATPIAALAIAGTLGLFLTSAEYRRAIAWAALLGAVLGFWTLAPAIVHANHFQDLTARQWLTVEGVMATAFVALGSIIGIVASWPFCAYWKLRGRRGSPLASWALAAAVLPAGYLAISWCVEWTIFRRPPPIGPNLGAVASAAVIGTVFGWLASKARGGRPTSRLDSPRLLWAGTALAAIVGCLAVPLRTEALQPQPPAASIAALDRRSESAHAPPLLVIGLDGGNWDTLRPLIARLPNSTFGRLSSTGMTGTVEALWPPYWSTPAWAAILTGYPEDQVGVHEDLAATAEGLPPFELPLTLNPLLDPLFVVEYGLIRSGAITPTPAPRQSLLRPPMWERLSEAGVKTAVVRFPFTYPADHQADYVVSNRVATDLWGQLGVKPGLQSELVGPPDQAAWLRQALANNVYVDPGLSDRLLPANARRKPKDAIENPADVLDQVLGISQQMFSTTEQVIRHDGDLRVVMLHVTSFDNICHAFWQYRFPDAFGADRPAQADIDRLGPVVDRYLEYVDEHVGQLIAAFPKAPNVIIVSDHGEEATTTATLWKGWHSRHGVFLAAGPSIAPQSGDHHVSYYDIAPTMLSLLGFGPASDLRGVSLVTGR